MPVDKTGMTNLKRYLIVLFSVVIISAFLTSCRTVPDPLYGVTFDNDGGASQNTLNAQAAMLSALPHEPTVRVVLDEGEGPSQYTAAFAKFQPIAFTMAELLDSSSLEGISPAAYEARATQYLDALGGPVDGKGNDPVDIWEIGNEVNGNWTGSYSSVADKIIRAERVVTAHNKRSALTLWENSWAPNHCGNGNSELTAQQFSSQYIPQAVRERLLYVFISWYPTQCGGLANNNVPVATIKSEFVALHALYPNAKLGFGEVGLPNKVGSGTLASAQSIASYYYNLDLGLSYYTGGYFWWYAAQDMVPTSKPMFATISQAMQ